jgi:hypothetical protein
MFFTQIVYLKVFGFKNISFFIEKVEKPIDKSLLAHYNSQHKVNKRLNRRKGLVVRGRNRESRGKVGARFPKPGEMALERLW